MANKIKQGIKFEFFEYINPNSTPLSITLPYKNFASIKFICGGQGNSGSCIINNIYRLDSLNNYITGTANYPFELVLNTNLDEIDESNYTIILNPLCAVRTIVKFYSK